MHEAGHGRVGRHDLLTNLNQAYARTALAAAHRDNLTSPPPI